MHVHWQSICAQHIIATHETRLAHKWVVARRNCDEKCVQGVCDEGAHVSKMQKCVSGHAGKCTMRCSSCAFLETQAKYTGNLKWGAKNDYRLISKFMQIDRTFPIGRHANVYLSINIVAYFEVERAIWFEFFVFIMPPALYIDHLGKWE